VLGPRAREREFRVMRIQAREDGAVLDAIALGDPNLGDRSADLRSHAHFGCFHVT
jgi:hypothetical protein